MVAGSLNHAAGSEVQSRIIREGGIIINQGLSLKAYHLYVQSAGQRQVEDILHRLLDKKFSDFQSRRKVKEEGWLKAIDQLCRAQEGLADEVYDVRLQLSQLEGPHHHAMPVGHSVTSSFNVGLGYGITQPEQLLGSTASMLDRMDYNRWIGCRVRCTTTVAFVRS